jgi:hypothetical protein
VEITLQQLLDEIAKDGGDLAALLRRYSDDGALSGDQITELVTEAQAAFTAIQTSESLSAADLPQLQTLADTISALNAESAHLTEQAEQTAAQVAELARAAGLVTEDETPGDGDESDDADGEGADGNDGETPAEGDGEGESGDADNSDSGLTVDEIVNAPVVDTTDTPEPVAASGTSRPRARVNLTTIASRVPRPRPESLSAGAGTGDDLPFRGSLVASADAPGMRGGSPYNSWLDLGRVAANAFGSQSPSQLRSLVAGAERQGTVFSQRSGLAEFRMNFPEDLIANGSDDTEVFARAADQSRLPGGSLLAAGGWCAPSETMYDLCELPCSLDGILSLPEVGAPRGGVRWTKGLDFCEIYNSPGFFHFTEAQMMGDPAPEKPCMEIPCVDFEECRLDVDGLCITGDIPQSRTYPEVIAQFLQGAMCAHAHRVNANKINQIVQGSTNDGTITQTGYGATNAVLYAIELEIQAYRYRGRRAQEGTPALLELVAPYWVKAVIRADIANRNAPSGIGNPQAVSDAEIVQWFATRGVAVRFVYDWQDLTSCNPSEGDPNRPITDYPDTVEFLLYEAGTWIVPTLDVITLENLYDSTLIKQNKYTALFTEQAFCVIQRCNGSRRFTVPICANGNTGGQVEITCTTGPAAATGATAGTPGTFTPAGSDGPDSLAALRASGVTASPATAWTTGQYIVLDDGTHAYWDGDSWEAGEAP